MKYSSTNHEIRAKVSALIKERGIKKIKLGEVLGAGKREISQQQFLRASRFLKGKGDVKVETLLKLIRFFEKPLSYFIGETGHFSHGLSTSEKKTVHPPKDWQEVKKSLEALGFKKSFIDQEIAKLKKAKK